MHTAPSPPAPVEHDHVPAWLARIIQLPATLIAPLHWTIGSLLYLLIGILLLPLPQKQRLPLGRKLLGFAFRTFTGMLRLFLVVRIDDTALRRVAETLPSQGGLIVAPNHPALWDAVFVLARLPHLTCIMKAAILRNPLLGVGASLAGFIPNDPPAEMIKTAAHTLEQGGQILLFPEGTRTRSENFPVNPFKGGIGILATKTRTPVLPIYIRTNSDFLSKERSLLALPKKRITITLTTGQPVAPLPEETSREFTSRLHEIYTTALTT